MALKEAISTLIFGDYRLAMVFCRFEKWVVKVFEVMEGEVNHNTIQRYNEIQRIGTI